MRETAREYIIGGHVKWLDEERLIGRIADIICEDCPAQRFDNTTGMYECHVGGDILCEGCVRWFEAVPYLEGIRECDLMLKRLAGN